ncbi:MAG: hypothetical protein JNN33_11610 [Rhodospirillaceae bacterium]|nr:hypothetical protein [Rhodospirillaceae bacterium]
MSKAPREMTAQELHRAAVFSIWPERPESADPTRHQVWAYCDRLSYAPGEIVRVHVSTTAESFDLEVTRDGARPEIVLSREGLRGHAAETPPDCSVKGCGWPVAFEFALPAGWPSAVYRLTTRVAASGNLRANEHHHLFILRPPRNLPRKPDTAARQKRLLLVAATATWTAYNDWGGSNHYEGITGPNGDLFSPVLSTQRPWAKGFVVLPINAPRVTLSEPPAPLAPPRYPHMEWALLNGYSKKYASAGWASYDRHFAHWAERQGYALDICSQTDLHLDADLLQRYACVAFIGHCEYWSWQMRDAVEAYVEGGGRVARFAGNFCWQIRLEDEGRTQICYKYRAPQEDPVYGTDRQHFATNLWEAPEVGRPGASTFGLNTTSGIYVGWGGAVPRGSGGFPIYRPDHWAFKGTGLYYGDVLGAQSRIFGYEVDGLAYEMRNGQPYPAANSGAPAGTQILAMGQASLVEEGESVDFNDVFIGHLDVAFIARTLLGRDDADAIERTKRTNGMMVNFARGRGEVFHAGSCEWVAGLLRRDPMVERVTRNVIDKYLEDGAA